MQLISPMASLTHPQTSVKIQIAQIQQDSYEEKCNYQWFF